MISQVIDPRVLEARAAVLPEALSGAQPYTE